MGKIRIDRDVDLQALNTLAIPAKAAYCATCASKEDLQNSLNFARQHGLDILVLGEGSNTVFTKDYSGLVILNRLRGIETVRQGQEKIEIKVGAGEVWHHLVEHSIKQGWFGLENLALIPGLVGASPIQNIGAYGVEVKEFITAVEFIEVESGEVQTLSLSECLFSYRDSIFKKTLAGKTIITAVNFRLSRVANCNISYLELAEGASPKDVFDTVCQIRSAKLPSPDEIPNAGSFFKNPIVSTGQYQRLLDDHPDIVGFEQDSGWKLAAAWLIEQRGWKDKPLDGVQVHQQQALVVTNPMRRNGTQVLALARAIQQDIKMCYSVNLEIEPMLY